MPDLITVPVAAAEVGVAVNTIRNYLEQKKLTEYKHKGRAAVDRAEVQALFGTNLVSAPPAAPQTIPTRIFAVANQKGGTGKTTTSAAIGYLLALRAPTLLIDADPQGNLTQTFGLDSEALPNTLYDILVENVPAETVLRCLPDPEGLALIGSNLDLADTTLAVSGSPYWGALLRDALTPLLPRFRYIVIDCPPSLDALTVNSLVAATEVIVPVEMGAFSLRGTSRLLKVVNNVRKLNPTLPAPRFLACRTETTRLSDAIRHELVKGFGDRLFETSIRKGTAVGQAQFRRRPLELESPTSAPAKDYRAFVEELLHA